MMLTTRFKILCGVAAAIGVFIVVTWPSDQPEAAATAAAASSSGVASRAPHGAALRAATHESSNPFVRLANRVTASKAVEALFHTQSWYVAPPPPPPAPVVVAKPPPPTAPPLPFTVMGSYAHPGEATVYFLTRGDSVFDVHIGDTIDGTYSVDGVANGQLNLTYKPLNIQQTLPLGDSK